MIRRILLPTAILLMLLAGCGVEGDLYREESPEVKHKSERSTPRPTQTWEDEGGEVDRLNR